MEHWHLYVDETGTFEGRIGKRRILGMLFLLVEKGEKTSLTQEIKEIYKKYYQSKYPHARDEVNNDPNKFLYCMSEIVDIISRSNIKLYHLKYKEDVNISYKTDILREEYLANRYFNMLLNGFEYILFLDTTSWGKNLEFSFFPCTRSASIEEDNLDIKKKFKQAGFSINKPRSKFKGEIRGLEKLQGGKRNEDRELLVPLIDNDLLWAFIYKMLKDYMIYFEKIGERRYGSIRSIIADKSKDVFVHLVDNLLFILRDDITNKGLKQLQNNLKNQLTCYFEYSKKHETYKSVLYKYFMGDKIGCLTEIIRQKDVLSLEYMRNTFSKLISMLLEKEDFTFSDIETLESLINNDLRTSRGNWDYISQLIDYCEKILSKMYLKERSKAIALLLKRIYTHKLSIHNHRSEFLGAYQTAQKIAELQKDYFLSFDELRQDIEIRNRIAIAYANMFEFQKSNESLKRDIEFLLEQKTRAQSVYNREIKDTVLGKLYGTIGQNYAFLAPFDHNLFSKAEDFFYKAKAEFTKESDKQRQDVYLLHLYYDWRKIDGLAFEKGKNLLKELISLPDVQKFLNNPTPENAKYKQFLLQIYLKYHLDDEGNDIISYIAPLCNKFSLSRLKYLFKDAADEHPFEFIFAYLGIMSMKIKRYDNARDYFAYAIRIPLKGRRIQQPTLQAIRAQILTRYAMELYKIGQEEEARNKMVEAVKIMEQLGRYPEYAPILQLKNGKAIGGWFKDAWNSLSKIEWNKDFDLNTCEMFLKYFTFNYA